MAADDAGLLVAAIEGFPAEPYERSNEHVLHDDGLPALVRGFIACNMGNATETLAISEAGMMPRLYATYQGERVRVVMVSRLGDVGISRKDEENGYFTRCSIYDLTDFADQMHPEAPSRRPTLTFYTIVDKKGRWINEPLSGGGGKMLSCVSAEPMLFIERSTCNMYRRKYDPHGLLGYETIPVKLSKVTP